MINESGFSPDSPAAAPLPPPLPSGQPSSKRKRIAVLSIIFVLVFFSAVASYFYFLSSKEPLTPVQNESSQNNKSVGQSKNMKNSSIENAVILADVSNTAFVVYMAVSEEVDIEEAKRRMSPAIKEVAFEVIASSQLEDHIKKSIKKNEYPEIDVAKELAGFLELYPMTPIGLTWNGGIALTFNDYSKAESLYEEYQKNSSGVLRPEDQSADPNNPANF